MLANPPVSLVLSIISPLHNACNCKYKHEKCTMGLFQKLALFLGIRKKEVNVLVIGLNNSGKSTVINRFKNEEDRVAEIVPTVGFSVERFQRK